jgi:hypothetical protein
MLELNDPLWNKLHTMFGKKHIPTLLSALAASWHDKTASTLQEELWHQNTCCGATYAAVPHLLKIADPAENRRQRLEIASFLGQVTLDTDPRQGPGSQPEDRELPALILGCAIEPVNASDLEQMRSIMAEFYSALPAIRALCERALLENWGVTDCDLLSGIAAADGLIGIASLLNSFFIYGGSGGFTCSSCGWGYEFIRFGDRFAVYAETPRGAPHDDKGSSDFKDGAPSRADGFIMPITEDGILDARVAALLALAKRAPSPEPALLLRHFAGSFVCCKCGVLGPMHPVW